jgi:hypothetical protein
MPINQVILGGDPLLGNNFLGNSIDDQLQLLEKYRQNLEAARQIKQQNITQQSTQKLIWDEIDNEIQMLDDEQKSVLFNNEEYMSIYNEIQTLVNIELLALVKNKIEASNKGKELLERQLAILKRLKSDIIKETNTEIMIFRKFKEYSKLHPEVTYDEFLNINK